MKYFVNVIIQTILMLILIMIFSSVSIFAEKYIGVSGPQTGIWNGSLVDMGAENIIHWSSANVSWYLNSNGSGDGLTFSQTKTAVQNSFDSWENISTSNINFTYQDSTSSTWSNDDKNVIYWAESGDAAHNYGGPLYSSGTIAVTIFTINSSEEFTNVDIVFDGRDRTWKIDGNDYDIQGVVTHEIGHMIGLHHTEISSSPVPTMREGYYGTDWRSLEFDDNVGASFLYGGNLIDNETFSGTDHYFWDLSVNTGKTLTVSSNSIIKFASGKKLDIYGDLDVSSNVTFTR